MNPLLERLQSPSAFRDALLVDVDGEPTPLAEVIEPWQTADFEAVDPAWQRVAGRTDADAPVRRVWLERPRGHSKTSDAAISATYVLSASRHPIRGVAAAADRDQAALLRDAVERLTRLNRWLSELLSVNRSDITNSHTGSRLDIITSDAASSFGHLPDFVICDELTHWTGEGLWHSLLSSSDKRRHCVLEVITNAGHTSTWQHDVREAARTSEQWHFSALDGPQASWMTADRLAEQRRLLPSLVYKRLWQNEWTSLRDGDAIPSTLIEHAVTMAGPITGPMEGCRFIAGLDLATRRDWSALVILAIDEWSHRIHVADVQVWKPTDFASGIVDLQDIEDAIIHAQRLYRLTDVFSDSWQAEHLSQRLWQSGIELRIVHPTAPVLTSQAQAMLDVFQTHQIDLYPDAVLMRDISKLRIVERTGGGLKLEASRDEHGHADAAFALAVAMPAALDTLRYGVAVPEADETEIMFATT